MPHTVLSGAFPKPHLFVVSVYLWFLWSVLQPLTCYVSGVYKVLKLRFTLLLATELCILVTRTRLLRNLVNLNLML
jgi:hypothetical protein